MHSCFYVGQVRHRRHLPRPHKFVYKLFYMYIDLDETDRIFKGRWLWSTTKPALARFKRSDYLGPQHIPLKQAVYDRIEQACGVRPTGPVRLLTHLRYFGITFNPVSFYYVFDHDDRRLDYIVAEITNTPWNERHSYVLTVTNEQHQQTHMKFNIDKEFHVSPFMPMDINYHWRLSQPDDILTVHINNHERGNKLFDATLSLKKQPITASNCASILIGYPAVTLKVISTIYWQALKLFLKKIPFYSHPNNATEPQQGGAEQAN